MVKATVSQYKRRKSYFRKYEHDHHKIRSDRVKRWYHRKKMEIFVLLGCKCIRCGESDWRCLQIDHVKGGGQKERKRFSCYFLYLNFVLKQIQSGSKDYQLLCANCNWKKRYEGSGEVNQW